MDKFYASRATLTEHRVLCRALTLHSHGYVQSNKYLNIQGERENLLASWPEIGDQSSLLEIVLFSVRDPPAGPQA